MATTLPGLSDADHVLAGQGNRHALRLNWRAVGEIIGVDSLQNLRRQSAQLAEAEDWPGRRLWHQNTVLGTELLDFLGASLLGGCVRRIKVLLELDQFVLAPVDGLKHLLRTILEQRTTLEAAERLTMLGAAERLTILGAAERLTMLVAAEAAVSFAEIAAGMAGGSVAAAAESSVAVARAEIVIVFVVYLSVCADRLSQSGRQMVAKRKVLWLNCCEAPRIDASQRT